MRRTSGADAPHTSCGWLTRTVRRVNSNEKEGYIYRRLLTVKGDNNQ